MGFFKNIFSSDLLLPNTTTRYAFEINITSKLICERWHTIIKVLIRKSIYYNTYNYAYPIKIAFIEL